MPFLCNKICNSQETKKSKSPSPKHIKHIHNFIKRASLSTFLNKCIPAGMTVEASIVLPLFMFFFVNLGCAMEMIRLHGNLQLALWNVGNKMCVYGHVVGASTQPDISNATEKEREWWKELGDIAFSYTYVKSQVVGFVGEHYLESSPLRQGVSSLQFWESDLSDGTELDTNGDVIDIVMTYQAAPWMEIPFVKPFRMCNRYYGRIWNGYDLEANGSESNEGEDVVYITENASVYHETLDCTHLKLTISEVTLEQAKESRNANGGSYSECLKCRNKRTDGGHVFIGRDGDCYHYDRNCSGLKRTIYTIPRKDAVKYRPCSRCAAVP